MLGFHLGLRCFKAVVFFGSVNVSTIPLLKVINGFLIDDRRFLMSSHLSLRLEMPIVTMFVVFVLFINGKVHHELLIRPDWPMIFIQTVSFVGKNQGLFLLIFLLFVHHFISLVLLLFGFFVQCLMQI